MAINIEDFDTLEQDSTDNLTVSMTATGSNRAFLVGVVTFAATPPTVTGITFNGSATGWSAVSGGAVTSGESRVELWKCIAPDATTASVVVTLSAQADGAAVSIWSLSGVNQTTPVSNANNAAGSGTSASVSLTVADADSLLLDMMLLQDPEEPVENGAQTQDANALWNFDVFHYGSSHKTASGDTSMSWTFGNDDWRIAGAVVKPAAAAGQTLTPSDIPSADTVAVAATQLDQPLTPTNIPAAVTGVTTASLLLSTQFMTPTAIPSVVTSVDNVNVAVGVVASTVGTNAPTASFVLGAQNLTPAAIPSATTNAPGAGWAVVVTPLTVTTVVTLSRLLQPLTPQAIPSANTNSIATVLLGGATFGNVADDTSVTTITGISVI